MQASVLRQTTRSYRSTLDVVIGRKKCVLDSAFAVGAICILATTAKNCGAKTANGFGVSFCNWYLEEVTNVRIPPSPVPPLLDFRPSIAKIPFDHRFADASNSKSIRS